MHCHPRPIEGFFRIGTGCFQTGQNFRHILRQLGLWSPGLMATGANRSGTREQGCGGRLSVMSRVTDGAAGGLFACEQSAMLRPGKSLEGGGMAFAARP